MLPTHPAHLPTSYCHPRLSLLHLLLCPLDRREAGAGRGSGGKRVVNSMLFRPEVPPYPYAYTPPTCGQPPSCTYTPALSTLRQLEPTACLGPPGSGTPWSLGAVLVLLVMVMLELCVFEHPWHVSGPVCHVQWVLVRAGRLRTDRIDCVHRCGGRPQEHSPLG